MSEKNNNEKKKEYLRQFLECKKAALRIEEQIKEIELNEMCPSIQYSDMPKGSGSQKDLSDYMAKKEELLQELYRARYKRIITYTDIFKRIEMLKSEDERAILTERYINGYKWEKIACDRHIEWTQVHRIHRRALENFIIPNEEGI